MGKMCGGTNLKSFLWSLASSKGFLKNSGHTLVGSKGSTRAVMTIKDHKEILCVDAVEATEDRVSIFHSVATTDSISKTDGETF